jgi:hypothetical protein
MFTMFIYYCIVGCSESSDSEKEEAKLPVVVADKSAVVSAPVPEVKKMQANGAASFDPLVCGISK